MILCSRTGEPSQQIPCQLPLLFYKEVDLAHAPLLTTAVAVRPGESSDPTARLVKLYHFGVVWKTKDCFRCECQPRAMICCSLVFRPTNYDRENCIALFHKKSCSMRVVWKSDPQEPCNVFAGVG
uniref:Beta-microseminoprotein n=1 Tax=Chelonoidis abingdonii TaxID=106734 RepID=A0A8C0HHU9_CHEAB